MKSPWEEVLRKKKKKEFDLKKEIAGWGGEVQILKYGEKQKCEWKETKVSKYQSTVSDRQLLGVQ